jgi:phosphomannomutase
MTPEEHTELLKILNLSRNKFRSWDNIGKTTIYSEGIRKHMHDVLEMKHINKEEIKKRKFKVLCDCVNGAGVYVIPELLRELGCDVIEYNCDKSGIFPRLPEPIPENLTDTLAEVKKSKADLGVVVDPDVDRLVLITDKGEPFGEENTITQAVKFILSKEKGNIVVNLSTTRGIDDVAEASACRVFRSAVGEANVVKKMKEVEAIIGGEGSGGVIYPALHYGRDALAGIAITLQHLVEYGGTMDELKQSLPAYFISKKKISVGKNNPDVIISSLTKKYNSDNINTEDGLRIDFPDHWVHFRKSNTEPIIRIITEAKDKSSSEKLSGKYLTEIEKLVQ